MIRASPPQPGRRVRGEPTWSDPGQPARPRIPTRAREAAYRLRLGKKPVDVTRHVKGVLFLDEKLVEIASGARADAFFKERSWDGGARTALVGRWEAPSSR
jgi:hypothetical protein